MLVNTLKAGARVVQREIAAVLEGPITSAPEAAREALSEEEEKAVNALGLIKTAVAVGLRQAMIDGHAGLRKMTRNLPIEVDAVMTG